MSATFEMFWDCQHCGTKKLLAITHRYCPSCGGMQKAEWRYFPSDAEKKEVADHRFVGADRTCPACRAPSSAAASHCGGCGSPLEGAKVVATRKDQEGTAFAGESEADARRERVEGKAAAAPPAPPPSRRKLWLTLGAVGLVLVAAVVAFTWKKEVQGRVVGHSWKREIVVETLGPVSDQAWCDSMPSSAYQVSRERAVRSHRQVPDGQECHNVRHDNGDGTFSEQERCQTRYREEPVYDDRCRFLVDRWHHSRTAVARGERLETPAWPETAISRTGTCVGCEREGSRSAAYVAVFEVGGKRRECELEEARWAELAPDSRWKLRMGALTGRLDCSTLRR